MGPPVGEGRPRRPFTSDRTSRRGGSMRQYIRASSAAIALAGLAAAVSILAAPAARGDSIAVESFAYPPGSPLVGNAGGTGFAGPWAVGGFNAFQSNYA